MLLGERYVEVAFPLPLNQTFTYRWKSDHADPVGYRVLVPFQKRLLTGYVINQSTPAADISIKDIQDVLDEMPVLTTELIQLIHHIREKYGTSLGEALQTVIPAGLIKQTKKTILVEAKEGDPETVEEKNLLVIFQKRKTIDWNTWIKKNPTTLPALRRLQKNGWIRVESILQNQKAKDSKEAVYYIKNVVAKLKGKKQQQVLDVIQSQKRISLVELKEVFGAAVTTILRVLESKSLVEKKMENVSEAQEGKLSQALDLTHEQKQVVDDVSSAIQNQKEASVLLHGVTGSGKTEVYLQCAQRCLDLGRTVLALVPEISLTPQFLTRFQKRFGRKIALLHSQRSETERLLEWKRVLNGDATIVVGTRSSIFSPLKNIGLFILDEEHDRSYKQDDHVMYHAREIAEFRAHQEKAVMVLGSATPSIETFHQTENKSMGKAVLSNRIHQQEMPEVEIVNLRDEKNFGEKTMFSQRLKDEITTTLENGKQVILFLNRRGYSTTIYCPKCGLTLQCPNCSISMTYHQESDSFQCHYCDLIRGTDQTCESCNSDQWIRFGFGTERVEKELRFMFPDARIDRLDRDTARKKNTFDTVFSNFAQKKTDILIGTQMITKGLDFEHVDLVGVLMADQSLNFPDFRASEMTFQLLTQVIGRAGRGARRGKAILQTLQPEHYSIVSAASQNYQAFYDQEIGYRKQAMYPPFSKVILFEIKGKHRDSVLQMAKWLKKQIESLHQKDQTFMVLGPSPAPIEKINNNFRFHLFLKSQNGPDVEKAARWAYEKSREEFQKRDLVLKFNIDPYDFM